MNTVVKGFKGNWDGEQYITVDANIDVTASRATGVWLINGVDNEPFRMIVGSPTEQDAARRYAADRKAIGQAPPMVYRAFPLVSLEPIALHGFDEEWSAFQNSWIEVRL